MGFLLLCVAWQLREGYSMGDGSRVDGVRILPAGRPRFEDLGYPSTY
ncbi:MAG: hypothetical protein QXK66_00190 [Sulfolobales archaeon]